MESGNSAWIWSNTSYQGPIDTKQSGSNFVLKTDENGRNIETKYWDVNHPQNSAWNGRPSIEHSDDDWEVSDIDATTLHFFASKSWDYFKARFNRNGPDGDGGEVRVWSGASFARYGSYSRRFGKSYLRFGSDFTKSIDIVGHEFSHGVVKKAGLGIYNEHGALAESFCDIFGTMIQEYTYNSLDWEVGENLSPVVRSLVDPNSAGDFCDDNDYICPSSGVGNPDTYDGDFFYHSGIHSTVWDGGGVHTNSGVQNKWFYILANGESGTNDIAEAYNVQGIGEDEAAIITYINLVVNMQQYSNYADARRGAIAVADIRYGDPCAFERVQVQNAWYAVGLGEESSCLVWTDNAELYNNSKPIVFPNPSNGIFQIEFESSILRTIEVYDVLGTVVQSCSAQKAKFFEIDITNLPNGVYFARIADKFNNNTMKLMKQ